MLPGAQLNQRQELSSKPSLRHMSSLASSLPEPALAACMMRPYLPQNLASPRLMSYTLQDEQATALHKVQARLLALWFPAWQFPPCRSASLSLDMTAV